MPRSCSSPVWKYFSQESINGKVKAICKTCKQQLEPNTTGLRSHANKLHGIIIPKEKDLVNEQSASGQLPITDFTKQVKRDTLQALLARLCCKDGIPFLVIAKSEDIRKGLSKLGLGDIPTSPTTIQKHVLAYAHQIQLEYKVSIRQAILSTGQLSLSFDEWTSIKNKRYINVILHSRETYWSLGLTRVKGSTNSTLLLKDISTRLTEYDIDLSHILCLMTDGAAINGAMTRSAEITQQMCLAHGVQLAVNEALYRSTTEPQSSMVVSSTIFSTENETSESSDSEEEEDELWQHAFGEDEEPSYYSTDFIQPDIDILISKVRQTVKLFRKSPVKNDTLQNLVEAELGKKLELKRDVRTRWNSLSGMLNRFYLLRNSVSFALLKFSSEISFTKAELESIEAIAKALTSIEICVEAICRSDCSLYAAHLAVEITLDELCKQNTSIATELANLLISKLQPRLSPLYFIQLYLNNKEHYEKTKFTVPSKSQLKAAISQIIRNQPATLPQSDFSSLPPIESTATELQESDQLRSSVSLETGSAKEKNAQKASFYKKLKEMRSRTPATEPNLEKEVNTEMCFYERNGHLGPLLQKVLNLTETVRPTTVDCERAFSIAGHFCSKVRSSLSDESLNALCILKTYFNKLSSNSNA